jgi:hypothetical protein
MTDFHASRGGSAKDHSFTPFRDVVTTTSRAKEIFQEAAALFDDFGRIVVGEIAEVEVAADPLTVDDHALRLVEDDLDFPDRHVRVHEGCEVVASPFALIPIAETIRDRDCHEGLQLTDGCLSGGPPGNQAAGGGSRNSPCSSATINASASINSVSVDESHAER